MTESKIILFSSSYFYLSFPQYKAIIPELSDFKKILLNVNGQYTNKLDNNYIKEKNVTEIFDIYIKMKPKKEIQFDSFKSYRNYKKLLTEYLYKINPNAIISGSDLAVSDRVMFSWCQKNKVPFFILQSAFLEGGIPEKYGLINLVKYIIINKIFGIPVYRKHNIYGNESQKSYLFLWGKYFIQNPKKKRAIITGNPAFDRLFKSFSPERKIKKRILICTQPFLDVIFSQKSLEKVYDIYLEAIKSKPEIKFYIKVHPRETLEKYEKIFPKSKFPNVIVVKEQDLYELFKLCDVQISVFSFSSVEAAVMGLPIIIIKPKERAKFPDHFREEIDIRVTEVEGIVNAINLALSDKYWNEFLEKREKYFRKILYSTDGQSAKRIAEVIKRLVKK